MGHAVYKLSPRGFLRPDGSETRAMHATGAAGAGSAEWGRRQHMALPGYEHELDAVPAETQRLYDLFSCYIARALLDGGYRRLLDVGCGIGSRLPPYVRPLEGAFAARGIAYVGLDPVEQNVSGRDYPFICGRIEDVPCVLDDRFDLFLFSTSLDHVEDTGRAAAAVRELSAERALAVFWLGLHDPALVAEEMGRKWFGRLYSSLNPLAFLWRAALVVALMLRRYPDLVRRARNLERGVPLDSLHFAYFTRASVRLHLERFGAVRDFMLVPGTNSAFAAVEIRGAAAR
jgi:SAM-dependent methyltransferase